MTGSSLPLALSLSSSLKTVGDYAGFAAIVGLAVLAMLYFAQAREVKRLREWAGRAPERDAEQEGRILEQAQARTSAAVPGVGLKEPSAAVNPVTPAGATVRDVKPVGTATTPAGTPTATPPAGAPAAKPPAKPGETVASPTERPSEPSKDAVPVDQTQIVRPATPATAGASPATPAAGGLKPSTPAGNPAAKDAKPAATTPATPAASPSPAAPKQTPPVKPQAPRQPVTPAAAAPLRRATPSAPVTARTARTAPEGAPPSRREKKPPRQSSGLPKPAVIIGTLVAIALVIFLFVQLTGGDSPQKPNQTTPVGQTNTGGGKKSSKNQPLARGRITVSVLNGTTVPGLAAQVADQVQSAGFKRGTVTNAADQQLASTTVFYAAGNSRAAKEVAKLIKSSAPQPIDDGTQSIAGAGAGVVVVVGSDRTQ